MSKTPPYPPATTGKYQPLGWTPERQFLILTASIKAAGQVLVPIRKDETGETLDGHHRELALIHLKAEGVNIPSPPIETVVKLTEEEKRHYALRINLNRRRITRKQRREIIANELRRNPKLSDAWLAEICGTTDKTVRSVREELESKSEIPTVRKFRRRDGKTYPRSIQTQTKREHKAVLEVLEELGDDLPAGPLTPKKILNAKRKHRAKTFSQVVLEPTSDAEIRLHHCGFQQLEAVAGLQPNSVNLVLTDIPYDKQWLGEGHLRELSKLAERVLVPGGLFVTYSGAMYLDEVMDQIKSGGLAWAWQATSCWKGLCSEVFARQVVSKSKPILIFSKGTWKKRPRWHDTLFTNGREKSHHHWQQPLEEAELLVSFFSRPGDLVADPCGGSFTNAVACKQLGRRFVGCDQEEWCVASGLERLATEVEAQPTLSPPNLKELSLGKKSARLIWVQHGMMNDWCGQDEEFVWNLESFVQEALHPCGYVAVQTTNAGIGAVMADFTTSLSYCGTISVSSGTTWTPILLFSKQQVAIDRLTFPALGMYETEMSLIRQFTEEGDQVVNLGSNHMAAACHDLGRECAGWAGDAEMQSVFLEAARIGKLWAVSYIFSKTLKSA